MTSRRSRREAERRIRALRPEPRREFVEQLSASIEPVRRGGQGFRARVAFSGALTALLLAGLGTVGGIGYAATAVGQAAHVVKKAFVPKAKGSAVVVRGLSAGGDQYQPGYGFGDDSHNHTGPPGLTKKGGEFAPPQQTKPVDGGIAGVVSSSITLDEQAHLYISVVDASGKKLLLTQKSKRGGSNVGGSLAGPQTKVIQYLVLVPRTIPLSVRVPANLLDPSKTYRIRVIAMDPDGNKSTTFLPFRA
jgi:hypothetical protein